MSKKIIDYLAILIAVLALSLTIWQVRIQIKHNQLSVEPRISSYFANSGKIDKWGIYIENNGNGTAFVKNFDVFIDKKKAKDHALGKIINLIPRLKLPPKCIELERLKKGFSIPKDRKILLFEVHPFDGIDCSKHKKEFLKFIESESFDFELTIESIYGVEFKYTFSENIQRKTK